MCATHVARQERAKLRALLMGLTAKRRNSGRIKMDSESNSPAGCDYNCCRKVCNSRRTITTRPKSGGLEILRKTRRDQMNQ